MSKASTHWKVTKQATFRTANAGEAKRTSHPEASPTNDEPKPRAITHFLVLSSHGAKPLESKNQTVLKMPTRLTSHSFLKSGFPSRSRIFPAGFSAYIKEPPTSTALTRFGSGFPCRRVRIPLSATTILVFLNALYQITHNPEDPL